MSPGDLTRRLTFDRHNSINYDHQNLNDDTDDDDNASLSDDNNNISHLLLHHSLTFPDEYRSATSQSLLCTPTYYSNERRFTIPLSFDSSNSRVWRRRLKVNSSPRQSSRDVNKNNVTLLTFARAVRKVCSEIGRCLGRTARALFVPRPHRRHVVMETEILEQTKWAFTDFIINRLKSRHLMSREIGLSAFYWPKSFHVINAGLVLELTFPEIYSNISRKLGVTLNSKKTVRNTLTLLFAVLFERDVTWGKITSMFVVSGLVAEECASHGHSELVKDVVDVVVNVTDCQLLTWLVEQGGWESFPVPDGYERSRLSKLRFLVLVCVTSVVSLSGLILLDVW